jgi:hypothetical protein
MLAKETLMKQMNGTETLFPPGKLDFKSSSSGKEAENIPEAPRTGIYHLPVEQERVSPT